MQNRVGMNYEAVLKNNFKLDQFRTGQLEIIESILNKKDTLAVLPTGGGKSLCFQFPAVLKNNLVIVISPLIALMKDQVFNLTKKGIKAGCLYSGQTDDEKRQIFYEMSLGGSYLLYLSPERVQKEGFKKWIQHKNISLFAIDEAHCVSQWGHDFREEYSALSLLKEIRPDVPVLALTASATPTVLFDIAKQLRLKSPQKFVRGFYRSNLYYQVETCLDDTQKFQWLLQSLRQTVEGRIIVYCGTRKITEEIALKLSKHFEKVGYYHAGLPTDERNTIQNNYEQGHIRILVATNAFGMGIDQPNVRLVVHFQMPANIDSLYQEMGRAGRDGLHSTCLLLFSKKDKGLQSYFIQSSEASDEIKNSRWRNLDTLVSYCDSNECRHREILTYYRDVQRIKECGHCDVCDPTSARKIQHPVIELESFVGQSTKALRSKNKYNLQDEVLNSSQKDIFETLKKWRKDKASELDVPAFVVFGDKTLRDLARKSIQKKTDLQNVYGIGEQKYEKFADELFKILKD